MFLEFNIEWSTNSSKRFKLRGWLFLLSYSLHLLFPWHQIPLNFVHSKKFSLRREPSHSPKLFCQKKKVWLKTQYMETLPHFCHFTLCGGFWKIKKNKMCFSPQNFGFFHLQLPVNRWCLPVIGPWAGWVLASESPPAVAYNSLLAIQWRSENSATGASSPYRLCPLPHLPSHCSLCHLEKNGEQTGNSLPP